MAEEAPKQQRTADPEAAPALLIPIASPLAGPKLTKRIYTLVSKATTAKKTRRGVKEVVKALRKDKDAKRKRRVCFIAGDITPLDVISHIPVLCEEAGVPYAFVRSREQLGIASFTKRPTSCVLVSVAEGEDETIEKLANACLEKVTALAAPSSD
eukprot:m51a1_g3296 putative h aca ribonucleoprotein complex subunit 2 (155) ;mRNA; f:287692-288348